MATGLWGINGEFLVFKMKDNRDCLYIDGNGMQEIKMIKDLDKLEDMGSTINGI